MANQKGGVFWPFVFLASATYFYFQPNIEWKKFFYSFIILIFYSLAIVQSISGDFAVISATLVFGAFFFLLLGIKDFVFINRENILNFLSGFLYFLISMVFFVADKKEGFYFLVYFLIAFASYYGLFKELVDFSYRDFPKTKRSLIVAGSAFIIMELASAVSLLPIGFLNSSALILLFIFILEDFIFYHLKGVLSRQTILNNATILIVAMIFIFATSRWGV